MAKQDYSTVADHEDDEITRIWWLNPRANEKKDDYDFATVLLTDEQTNLGSCSKKAFGQLEKKIY